MKKLKFIVLSIMLVLVFKIEVNATNLSLGISCPKTTYSGSTIKCTITSNVSGGMINGINANYSFSNASYQGFSATGSWSVYNSSGNGFAIGNTSGSSGGTIGTLSVLINASAGSSATISLTNIGASDMDYNDVSSSNASATINVIEKPVPTTTTRKKVLYLDSLSVEGYDIGFNKSTFEYTLDVGYEVSSLKVSATASNNYTVAGTGTLHINEGENSLLITVTDSTGEKSTYTIKVNRVVKVSNIVNNNVDEITNAFKSNDELIINLDMNMDELLVSQEILDIIKSQDRKLTYNIQNNGDTLYSYTFDGNKFNDSYNNINLKINIIEEDKNINSLLKDSKKIVFENEHKNIFPEGTVFSMKNLTKLLSKKNIRLYRENTSKSLELVGSKINVEKNDYLSFEIEKGAKYVFSTQEINSSNKSFIFIKIIIFVEVIILGILIVKKLKLIKKS